MDRKDKISKHVCYTCGIKWEARGKDIAAGVVRICPRCRKPNGDSKKIKQGETYTNA